MERISIDNYGNSRCQYDLYFGKEKQPARAATAQQAIAGCGGFLNAIMQSYLATSREENPSVCIVALDPKSNELTRLSTFECEQILEKEGRIALYMQSSIVGIYEEAKAIGVSASNKIAPIAEQIAATNEIKDAIEKVLATDDPERTWKPSDINELQVLQSAEVRLFAIKLRRAINKMNLQQRFILDHQCGFAEGTISRLLHPIDPLRPTKIMIEKIARVIRMKPTDLWFDLTSCYLNETNGWNSVNDVVASDI